MGGRAAGERPQRYRTGSGGKQNRSLRLRGSGLRAHKVVFYRSGCHPEAGECQGGQKY